MFVVDQTRTAIYNLNKADVIAVRGRQIVIKNNQGTDILGTYANEDRVMVVFNTMLDKWFPFKGSNEKRLMPEK